MMNKSLLLCLCCLVFCPASYAATATDTAAAVASAPPPIPVYSAEQLQADLRFLQETINATHPDTSHSVAPTALNEAWAKVGKQLDRPMTADQAWRILGRLNPLFADAHLSISWPNRVEQAMAHLAAGGTLFPFEVQVDEAGKLLITAGLGGAAHALAGSRIETINGLAASEVAHELLAYVQGDTPAFRAALLSGRWSLLYWQFYGAPDQFTLKLDKGGKLQELLIPASRQTPAYLKQQAAEFKEVFYLEILPNSKLLLVTPRFILARAAGDKGTGLVQPDILLPDDPLDKRVLINALLAKIAKGE